MLGPTWKYILPSTEPWIYQTSKNQMFNLPNFQFFPKIRTSKKLNWISNLTSRESKKWGDFLRFFHESQTPSLSLKTEPRTYWIPNRTRFDTTLILIDNWIPKKKRFCGFKTNSTKRYISTIMYHCSWKIWLGKKVWSQLGILI